MMHFGGLIGVFLGEGSRLIRFCNSGFKNEEVNCKEESVASSKLVLSSYYNYV